MSSNNSTYVYENLAPGSIRLLELLPGQKDSTLECKIITARKGEHLKYEALSYACGDPTPLHLVKEQLSGALLHIATNLHDALQRIRYENETRTLWVDAICIHQSNLDEKGHQVAHMGQIYRYAWRVIVWLPCRKAVPILNDFMDAAKLWTDNYRLNSRMKTSMRRMMFLGIFELPWSVLPLPLSLSPSLPLSLSPSLPLSLSSLSVKVCHKHGLDLVYD
jgi:hypothetical protein